jgi:hypothetical protein
MLVGATRDTYTASCPAPLTISIDTASVYWATFLTDSMQSGLKTTGGE